MPRVDMGYASFEGDIRHKLAQEAQAKSNQGAEIPSSWQHLAAGATLGKRVALSYVAGNSVSGLHSAQTLNLIQVRTDDGHAHQLSVILCPPQTFAPSAEIVALIASGDVQRASGEATNGELGTGTVAIFPNPTAIIEWGTGGVSSTAEVDFVNGANINLCAAFVRISATLRRPSTVTDIYVLSAFIGPGYPKTIGAQKTIICGTLAQNVSSIIFPVPSFSKKIFLTAIDNVDESQLFTGRIKFYDGAGITKHALSQLEFTPASGDSVAIPAGAAYFQVTNTSVGAHAMNVNAIFDLSI